MAPVFQVEVVHGEANGVRVRVAGDIDLATAARLRETILSVAPPPMHELVADLEEVSFMDSTGLAVLAEAHRKLLDHQVRLVIVNVPPSVSALLEMTRLDGLLTVEHRELD